jgi:hypothetical protein
LDYDYFCFSERDEFVAYLKSNFFEPLRALKNEDIHCPEEIPFVPYAYQTNNSRMTIRASPLLSQLHQVLVAETEIANIRQESR